MALPPLIPTALYSLEALKSQITTIQRLPTAHKGCVCALDPGEVECIAVQFFYDPSASKEGVAADLLRDPQPRVYATDTVAAQFRPRSALMRCSRVMRAQYRVVRYRCPKLATSGSIIRPGFLHHNHNTNSKRLALEVSNKRLRCDWWVHKTGPRGAAWPDLVAHTASTLWSILARL